MPMQSKRVANWKFSITPTYVGVILDFQLYVSLMRFFSQHSDWIKILLINQSNALSLQLVTVE